MSKESDLPLLRTSWPLGVAAFDYIINYVLYIICLYIVY